MRHGRSSGHQMVLELAQKNGRQIGLLLLLSIEMLESGQSCQFAIKCLCRFFADFVPMGKRNFSSMTTLLLF